MLLQADQVYASLGGITFGAVDSFGVDWSLQDGGLDGWGASKPTLQLTQRARQSGAWASSNFAGPRTISLSGLAIAPDAGALRDAMDRLASAVSLAPAPLAVTEAGVTRTVMVQRSDDIIVNWLMPTIASWSVQVSSADWRKFGLPVSGSTRLPSTSGGLSFGGASGSGDVFTPDQVNASAQQQGLMIAPNGSSGMYDVFNADGSPSSVSSITMMSAPGAAVSFPLSFNATVVTGQVSLFNPGNEFGPVTIRVDGPCVGPQIAHVSSGNVLTFSSSLVLQAGEWLEVDMEAQTVLANGQASRARFILSRGWAGFDPGENTWSFTATAYTSAAQMSVTAFPAWK